MSKMNYNRPQFKKKEVDYYEISLGEKLRHDKIKQRAPMPVKSVQEQKGKQEQDQQQQKQQEQ